MVQIRHHADEETAEVNAEVNAVTEKLAVLVTIQVAVGRNGPEEAFGTVLFLDAGASYVGILVLRKFINPCT